MHAVELWLAAATIFTYATRDANSMPTSSRLNMSTQVGVMAQVFDDYDYDSEPRYSGECGIPGVEPNIYQRIVGGFEAEPNSFPWHVKIKRMRSSGRFSFICGGSIVSPRCIVTAAHCVHNTRESHLKVVLGDHDRSVFEDSQMSVGVQEVVVHPGYIGMRNFWRNDLAVLKMDKEVEFTKYIRPICLPWHSCEYDIANCYVTGWGKDGTTGRPMKRLHQVSMNYYPNGQCNQPSWYDNLVQPTMLCAGHASGGKGTCQGDSGGPLMCLGRDATHWTLEGVTSWARGSCASTNHPTVFTRLCKYVEWIQECIIGNEEYYDYYDYDAYLKDYAHY